MKDLVGGYELRKLWEELQAYKPDENGYILFNFERFKRVHDIAPDAELRDFKESGEVISEEEAKMLEAYRMVWKVENEKIDTTGEHEKTNKERTRTNNRQTTRTFNKT